MSELNGHNAKPTNDSCKAYTNYAFKSEDDGKLILEHLNRLGTVLVKLEDETTNSETYDQENEDLFLISVNKVPKKDFRSEIRALKDVNYFLNDLVILLNLVAADFKQVIYHLVQEVMIQLINSSHAHKFQSFAR